MVPTWLKSTEQKKHTRDLLYLYRLILPMIAGDVGQGGQEEDFFVVTQYPDLAHHLDWAAGNLASLDVDHCLA